MKIGHVKPVFRVFSLVSTFSRNFRSPESFICKGFSHFTILLFSQHNKSTQSTMLYIKEEKENTSTSSREKIYYRVPYYAPAEMILRKVDELDCDAIVMGTHGKGFIRNTFLGSTSKRVLRRTRKPVFIIPLPKEGG